MTEEFVWASVQGASPEPATVRTEGDGVRKLYTAGCPDPFYLDQADCPAVIIGPLVPPADKEATIVPKKTAKVGKNKVPKGHSWFHRV